jgi:hypothetical protein
MERLIIKMALINICTPMTASLHCKCFQKGGFNLVKKLVRKTREVYKRCLKIHCTTERTLHANSGTIQRRSPMHTTCPSFENGTMTLNEDWYTSDIRSTESLNSYHFVS